MKKLILLIFILTVIFIPKNINALSFTANNDCEYQVSDSETLRDYFYFTNIYNNSNLEQYNSFSVFSDSINNYGVLFKSYTSSFNLNCGSSYCGYRVSCSSSFQSTNSMLCYNSSFEPITCINNNGSSRFKFDYWTPVYYNTSFINCSDSSQNSVANFSIQDILDKYSNLSCGSSSPEPEEPEESEVSDMFELSMFTIIKFIGIIPFLITIYLVFDLMGSILFGKR